MPRHPRADVRGDYILLNTAARLIQRRLDNALAPDYDGWETLREELTHLVASFQAPPEAGP